MSKERLIFDDESTKEWLIGVLKQYEVNIVFTKKDGTERKMLCTLKEELMPRSQVNSEVTEEVKIRKKPEHSLAVFDLDKKEWRSFRWDSINEIKFPIG